MAGAQLADLTDLRLEREPFAADRFGLLSVPDDLDLGTGPRVLYRAVFALLAKDAHAANFSILEFRRDQERPVGAQIAEARVLLTSIPAGADAVCWKKATCVPGARGASMGSAETSGSKGRFPTGAE